MQRRFPIVWVLVVLGILFYTAYYAQQKKEFALLQKEKGYSLINVVPIQGSLGWGYDIQVDGKTYIHQLYIPGISGRRGFDSKEDALLVGNKVVGKLTSSLPPGIHIDELKAWGIALKPSDTVTYKK